MRVTSSEVMGSLTVDDDKEIERGEDTGGVDENAAERGRGRQHRKTVLLRPHVFPPTYTTNDSLRRPFLSNRHLSRSLLFRLAVHTLLFCASVMLSGSL